MVVLRLLKLMMIGAVGRTEHGLLISIWGFVCLDGAVSTAPANEAETCHYEDGMDR